VGVGQQPKQTQVTPDSGSGFTSQQPISPKLRQRICEHREPPEGNGHGALVQRLLAPGSSTNWRKTREINRRVD
jgi:hypothetical protein